MAYTEEMLKSISAIYKFIRENPNSHRNTLRKQLLTKGKISSKEKFNKAFEGLVALGRIKVDKEIVSLNEDIVDIGVLQKSGDDFFIVSPNSKKHLKISKSVAAGYKPGDVLDIIVEQGKEKETIILGKSEKKIVAQADKKEKKKQVETMKESLASGTFRPENFVLGRVVKLSHDELVFIPNKKSLPVRQIPILNPKEELTAFQDKLCIMNLMDIDTPLFGGHIVEVKGDAGNPIHEYDAIAEMYGAVMNWNGEQLQREIDALPTSVEIDEAELITEAQAKTMQRGHTVDLRHLPFMTIDPATCKDMDDAIYSTVDENGDTVVYTAVANVTKYFDLDSEIGRKYMSAGFTFYAPNKAYNILPSKLSTGICSLNPNEDRRAFVVKTVIDSKTGKVKNSDIYDALINSREKYSYEQAQEIVDKLDVDGAKDYLEYKTRIGEPLTNEEQILMNFYSAQSIKKGFEARKMIRFNSKKEREIKFDSALEEVVDIEVIKHLRYHEVIEEFMVTANEASAKYAHDNGIDNIYRVHEEPSTRKLEKASEFFDILGIDFDGDLSAQGTRNLIELIRNTSNEEVINNFLIKMQSRAIYSDRLYPENSKKDELVEDWAGEKISHYALQSPHYSHTTAPIRRIVDYVTQYNILAHMHGTKPISKEKIIKIIDIANEMQLQVDQAEKDFQDISSVFYCEKHIGETFRGRISKIRTASIEEGYEDEIVVVVKDEEKGISAEIPLSQILGRPTYDCTLSSQHCAVYDGRGNVVLTLCKPIDFIVEKADRKTMTIVGRTNKELVHSAEARENAGRQYYQRSHQASPGYIHKNAKNKRVKRFETKKHHKQEREEHRESQQIKRYE